MLQNMPLTCIDWGNLHFQQLRPAKLPGNFSVQRDVSQCNAHPITERNVTQLQNPITAAQGMFLAADTPQVRAFFTVSQ